MSLPRLSALTFPLLAVLIAPGVAAEPVLLRHKFAKGDQLVYRAVREQKQTQALGDQKFSSTTNQETVTSQIVDEIDGDGNAIAKTKAVSLKMKADGQAKFEFDSKSTERDTASQAGAAITPILERLVGSEYEVKLSPRGNVVEVKGFAEIFADLLKDNPAGSLFAGVIGNNIGQKQVEQERFLVFSEKPVWPGDSWEHPIDADLKGIGKMKGKVTYTFEGDDKVGDRATVRIGVVADLTVEIDLEFMGAKATGTMTTTRSEGTAEFDPVAGRVLSAKSVTGMGGNMTINAGGKTFTIGSTDEHTTTVTLLDKLPD